MLSSGQSSENVALCGGNSLQEWQGLHSDSRECPVGRSTKAPLWSILASSEVDLGRGQPVISVVTVTVTIVSFNGFFRK